MPDSEKDHYAATCNPPRRAKRPSISDLGPRDILPMPGSFAGESALASTASPVTKRTRNSSNASHSERPYSPRVSAESFDSMMSMTPPPPAAKRGRKPGPLSKSAREAQRRLNHSIIEKARRTKINDALATLKQLVPADYLHKKQNPEDDEEELIDDDDEDNYEDGAAAKKATATTKQKPKGKKEEKEKEFKLEILVRTVAFLQDLLERVNELEVGATPPAVCHNCGDEAGKPFKKRKRSQTDIEMLDLAVEDREPNAKKGTQSTTPPQSQYHGSPSASSSSPAIFASVSRPQVVPFAHTDRTSKRLPSISSWLSLSDNTDPQLLPAPILNKPLFTSHNSNKNSRHNANAATSPSLSSYSYLPSPPSSTHFDPIRTIIHPPALNLGPVAVASAQRPPSPATFSKPVSSPHPPPPLNNPNITARTPEDESAASMLLHIATSPLFKPSTTITTSTTTTSSRSSTGLPDPSNFSLHSHSYSHSDNERSQRTGIGLSRQIETPSSILGIRK